VTYLAKNRISVSKQKQKLDFTPFISTFFFFLFSFFFFLFSFFFLNAKDSSVKIVAAMLASSFSFYSLAENYPRF